VRVRAYGVKSVDDGVVVRLYGWSPGNDSERDAAARAAEEIGAHVAGAVPGAEVASRVGPDWAALAVRVPRGDLDDYVRALLRAHRAVTEGLHRSSWPLSGARATADRSAARALDDGRTITVDAVSREHGGAAGGPPALPPAPSRKARRRAKGDRAQYRLPAGPGVREVDRSPSRRARYIQSYSDVAREKERREWDEDHAKPLLERSVDHLELSVRALNALAAAGIETVGQLARLSADGLVAVPGVGKKTRRELREVLRSLGLGHG
jgi:hypothetical protein